MSQLTFGSLFAGIGGFDLGLESAGMVCRWQVEIDQFCQKVLAKHWPDVQRYSDVKEVGKHNLEPVDVICGGFPCQPHSLAGKRKGAADDRDLWPEYRRIITELQPAWVIGENVPGIITTILDQVLSDLESLNYSWQAFVIPACGLNAQHKRDRIWIIANGTGNGRGEGKQDGGWGVAGVKARQEQGFGDVSGLVADTARQLLHRSRNTGENGRSKSTDGGNVCDTIGAGLEKREGQRRNTQPQQPPVIRTGRQIGEWWTTEPGICRVANGVPHRVDRLRTLGNAVVPQVVEFIGELVIRQANKHLHRTAQAGFFTE